MLRKNGIYAPLTTNGKIFVNGILASCYSEFEEQILQTTYFEVVSCYFLYKQVFAVHDKDTKETGHMDLRMAGRGNPCHFTLFLLTTS